MQAAKHNNSKVPGGTTRLTLLVLRRSSSKVASDVAKYGDP